MFYKGCLPSAWPRTGEIWAMEERRPDGPSGSPEMHTGRLICGLAGTFYTGKDQSFALDVKVSTS